MAVTVSDAAFARAVQQAGVVSYDQLEAAKAAQAESAAQGVLVSLSDILVQQGVITTATRENIEKKAQAEQTGGMAQLGPYKLLKKLGEGGMGAVYLAEDTMVGRKVAVKVLPKKYSEEHEFLTRFRREAQATGKLNHPNIVVAYNVDEEAGTHYYAMEYCEGDTLDRILKRDKVVPWDAAVDVVTQVARGLKHAHDHGIIHRDIKPANIFVCKPLSPSCDREGADGGPLADARGSEDTFAPGFVAKILDLGLSKNIGSAEQSYLTQTGAALGTPHYLSPEQAKGDKGIDGRTDIYSLGATFYHLVTGQTPFTGSTAAIVMMKHLNEQLPNPQDLNADIPDGVAQVIAKMMAKEPADRHANCAELIADLDEVAQGKLPSSQALDVGKSSVAVARRVPQSAGLRKPQFGKLRNEPRGTRQQQPVTRPSGSRRDPADRATTPVGKYIGIGVAVLGAVVLAVGLGIRASRERAAEQARAAEEARLKQEADARQRLEDQYQAALNEARRELQGEGTLAGYYLGLDAAKLKRVEGALGRALSAKPGDAAAKELQGRLSAPKEIALDLGGGVKMDFALIPAGEFMMGEKGVAEPAHKVKISKPFYLGKYEVTQAQYEKVMGTNPSRWKGADLPVEQVSWDDAKKFCELANKLCATGSLRSLLAARGNDDALAANGKAASGTPDCGFRLPTEAQWEYACRAGTTTEYNTGQGEAAMEKAGWYSKISGGKTNPVGKKAPNAWGLYDMHGNVWEWCEDRFGEKYYAEAVPADPPGLTTGGDRVLRGGSWNFNPGDCRSATRNHNGPGYRSDCLGFRVRLDF